MGIKYLPPKSDFVFKKIFGDPKNVDILTAFLKSTLDIPHDEYEKITLVDTHLPQESRCDKLGILDVKVQTKSGNIIDIEIQLANIPHMRERIVFYLSKMVSEQIKSGEKYGSIKRSIIIVITDYKIIKENEKYHNVYTLRNKDGEEFTNLIEVNTLELPKLPDKDDNTNLWNWMKFLKSEKEEEFKMVEVKDEKVSEAVVILKRLSESEEMQLLHEHQEKIMRDQYDRLEGAFEKGLNKGLEEGEKKGKAEGLKEGKAEGLREGETKGRVEVLITLVEKYHIKLSTAMSDVGLNDEYKNQIVTELNKRQINYEE